MQETIAVPSPSDDSRAGDSDRPEADRPSAYDAVILVSFGGPDGPDDVMPFLENVLRGRNVPRERMLEVAEHYHHTEENVGDTSSRRPAARSTVRA
jgi:hypothetical protein